MSFGTSESEAMRIDTNGNVGIEYTTPSSMNSSAYNLVVGNGVSGENKGITIFSNSDASGSIHFADGTSGADAYRGIITYSQSGNHMRLYTDATERVRINAQYGVGIGTAADHLYTSYRALELGHAMSLTANGGGNDCQIGNNFYLDESGNWSYKHSAEATLFSMSAGNQIFYNAASGTADAHITWSERMRIAGGQVLIGISSAHDGNFKLGGLSTASVSFLSTQNNATTGTMSVMSFRANSNTEIGSIKTTNTATAFNTSSDYRLKENLQPLENGLERLNNLNPVKFDWKEDGTSSEGFIAHEAQEVFPDAVTGEKDGEDMQGMDYGRITPLLVKAIQEQQEQIEQLKAEVQTLKENK